MQGVLFQRTMEDHVVFRRDKLPLSSLEDISLLPLRGFHLKSFGNLNKSEGDTDIDPLWSPTMNTEPDRFPDPSNELPTDLSSSPWSSASDYSPFPDSVLSPTYGSTFAAAAGRHEHRDPVADQTREDFFFDCESNPYHSPSPNSSLGNHNYFSPFSESDSLQDYSPLSMQTTMTPPEQSLLNMGHVDDNIWIKNSDDLAHSEGSAIMCKKPVSEVPPILITPCEDIDVSCLEPFNNRRSLSVPRFPTKKRRRGPRINRIIDWRSTVVDSDSRAMTLRRNIAALPTSLSRNHVYFSEVRKKSTDVAEDVGNETPLSLSEMSEARQSSTILAFEDDDTDADDGSNDERSGGEESYPSDNICLSNTAEQPPRTDDNFPIPPPTLSTVLRNLDVSEVDTVSSLISRRRSVGLESSGRRQNPLTVAPNNPSGEREMAKTVLTTSCVTTTEPSPGTSNEAPSGASVSTHYLLRTRRRSPASTSRVTSQSSSEDDRDEVAWHTTIRDKRKSPRKSVKTEESDNDNFVLLKRQTKRARKIAPPYPKRGCKARPSTKHIQQVYTVPGSDQSADWQALKMADGRFACNKCGIGFNRRHDLSRHWRASCIERPDMESGLTCHVCGKGESRKDALDRHMKNVHRPA